MIKPNFKSTRINLTALNAKHNLITITGKESKVHPNLGSTLMQGPFTYKLQINRNLTQ